MVKINDAIWKFKQIRLPDPRLKQRTWQDLVHDAEETDFLTWADKVQSYQIWDAHPITRTWLLVFIYWLQGIAWCLRYAFCDHKNMIDEGYGGPDHGYDAGSCPDCGFSYHHSMY